VRRSLIELNREKGKKEDLSLMQGVKRGMQKALGEGYRNGPLSKEGRKKRKRKVVMPFRREETQIFEETFEGKKVLKKKRSQ